MPKLTSIEGTTVSRQRTQAPQVSISVTPEQIAGSEVRLLTELGKKADEVTAFVVKRQNTKDLEIVTRADTALKETLMEQRLGAQKRPGINASGLLTEQTALLDSNMRPVEGQPVTPAHQRYIDIYNSADPRQKRAMDLKKSSQRLLHLKSIGTYEQAQTSAAAVKGSEANVAISVAHGIAGTLEDRDQALSDITKQYNSIQALTGAETSTIESAQMKDFSAIHTGRLENLISAKDIKGAEEYFEKYKDQMLGDTSAMKKAIAARKVDVKSELESDHAFEMWADGDMSKAYNYIDAIEDPALQEGARAELEAKIKNAKSARTEQTYRANATINAAMFEKNAEGEYVVKSFTDMPQDVLAHLVKQPGGLGEIAKLKTFFAVRDNPIDPPIGIQMRKYDQLMKLAKSPNLDDRQKFLGTNIAPLLTLGESYKKQFIDLQAEMTEANSKEPGSILTKADHLSVREGFFRLEEDGYEEVRYALQGQLNEKVKAAEAELKRKGDPRKLSVDEYSDLVKEVYAAGAVQKLKDANYSPTPPKPGKQVQTIDGQITDAIDLYKVTDDEDKNHFTTKLMSAFDGIRSSNIAAGRPSVPTYQQTQRVIKFAVKDKVWRDDTWYTGGGGDNAVMAITLNDEEAGKAYVKTAGGYEVLIKDIDAVKGEALKQLDSYIVKNNLTYSYEDRANALETLGTKAVIEKRRKSLTTGSIKASNGDSLSREGIIDVLSRNDVATLKSKETRDKLVKIYSKEILPILNFVIRQKERAAQ